MEPFTRVEGVVCPLDRSDVDTDQIIPKQFLKRIERTGFGSLFWDWRGEEGFPLDRPEYAGRRSSSPAATSVRLLAEHAPGRSRTTASGPSSRPSFADIFRTNCTKIGLLPGAADRGAGPLPARRGQGEPGIAAVIDLERQVVVASDGASSRSRSTPSSGSACSTVGRHRPDARPRAGDHGLRGLPERDGQVTTSSPEGAEGPGGCRPPGPSPSFAPLAAEALPGPASAWSGRSEGRRVRRAPRASGAGGSGPRERPPSATAPRAQPEGRARHDPAGGLARRQARRSSAEGTAERAARCQSAGHEVAPGAAVWNSSRPMLRAEPPPHPQGRWIRPASRDPRPSRWRGSPVPRRLPLEGRTTERAAGGGLRRDRVPLRVAATSTSQRALGPRTAPADPVSAHDAIGQTRSRTWTAIPPPIRPVRSGPSPSSEKGGTPCPRCP